MKTSLKIHCESISSDPSEIIQTLNGDALEAADKLQSFRGECQD